MGFVTTDDGVNLYYEEVGEGTPIVFVHEYAGDHRSWEPQMRHFGRRYRCITYAARGYTPSDVPESPQAYGQDRAREDIRSVLDGLGIDAAHVVGLSMGGFAALHFGFHHPDRALSLTVAGCGYGADADRRDQFRKETEATADRIAAEGMTVVGKAYAIGPTRVQFETKDPRGWKEFETQLCEHSTLGSANTMRGVQARRPSLYDLVEQMKALTVPTLIVNGDEDDPCLDVGNFMKRMIPSAALSVLPKTGHTMNIEEPALFNAVVEDFFHTVECGRWGLRDPRSTTGAIITAGPVDDE
ncbi:MAG: alpha/beta hydrolase [Alphaproteobacteria bacterium]|nr:alpha/beta hydrolase [Alphaproteobacteria bacterium]